MDPLADSHILIRTSLNKCKDIDGLLQTFKSRTPFFIQLVYFSYTLFLRYSSIVRELQMYPRKLSCAKILPNMHGLHLFIPCFPRELMHLYSKQL